MQTAAVIGCGPAGIQAALALQHVGLRVTCFDVQSNPGGMWNFHDSPYGTTTSFHSPVYPAMRTALPKDLMAFTDQRFSFLATQFPHHALVKHYVRDYAQSRGIINMTRFNTQVTACVHNPVDEQWKLQTHNLRNGDVFHWSFDKVVVAGGCTSVAAMPAGDEMPGLDSFVADHGGIVVHSSQFRYPREYLGRRVVVVGAGVSAFDVAGLLKAEGVDVTHVYRSKKTTQLFPFMSRRVHRKLKVPSLEFYDPKLDVAPGSNRSTTTKTTVAGNIAAAGTKEGWDGTGSIQFRGKDVVMMPTCSKTASRAMSALSIPYEIDQKEAVRIRDVDIVIMCTGFRRRMPFFEEGVEQNLICPHSNRIRGLRMLCLHKDHPSSLGFVNTTADTFMPFLVYEAQAKFIAHVFVNRVALPEPDSDSNAAASAVSKSDRQAHHRMKQLYKRFDSGDEAHTEAGTTTSGGSAATHRGGAVVSSDPAYSPRPPPHVLRANRLGLWGSKEYYDGLYLLMRNKQETFIGNLWGRKHWLLGSGIMRAFHFLKSLAPQRRKYQHIVVSNDV